MPFIPHTPDDIKTMLASIGVSKIDDLFDEIPASLRNAPFTTLPAGVTELELNKAMKKRADQDGDLLCFIGAGAYEHHIPAAVWEIATRGEFMTAYTPYQAEASQGNLQLLYEFQTMIANLMAMEVANASLYDGASALAEAILMAIRLSTRQKKRAVMMPKTVHPHYRDTVKTILSQQNITIIDIDYDKKTGKITLPNCDAKLRDDVAALVIPQPNFFGVLEDVDALSAWARAHDLLSIAVVNPLSMALLKPPGEWNAHGVDIACGEGQPLGIPLANGGPYYGFLAARLAHVRQMPGRIVGRTVDAEGRQGFVLTLQAREQHIRRSKATSNICTNQGLMVTASTIYMSLLGPYGLRQTALACHANSEKLLQELLKIRGIERVFNSAYFHEIVLRLPFSVDNFIHDVAQQKIQAGFNLSTVYPELPNCLLINVTETKSDDDIALFVNAIRQYLKGNKIACQA